MTKEDSEKIKDWVLEMIGDEDAFEVKDSDSPHTAGIVIGYRMAIKKAKENIKREWGKYIEKI